MKLARVSPLALRQRRASAIIWLTAERRHAVRSIASAAQAIRPIVASFADSLMTCQRASLVQALAAAAKAKKVESQTTALFVSARRTRHRCSPRVGWNSSSDGHSFARRLPKRRRWIRPIGESFKEIGRAHV